MKRSKSLLFCVICLFGASACSIQTQDINHLDSNTEENSTSTNNENKTMVRYYVDADYNSALNTVSINTDGFTLPNNIDLMSKQNNKKLSNFIVGDYLEVYYSDVDNNVDEIVVDEADVLSISFKKQSIPGEQPGSGKFDLVTDDYNIYINHDTISYVINSDGSITKKEDIVDNTILYGVYREEDIQITDANLGFSVYYLVGLYSFLPRSN